MIVRRLVLAALMLSPVPAFARPRAMGWGGERDPWDQPRNHGADSREGKVSAEHFVADGAGAALGHGRIALAPTPGSSGDARENATFEAAVIDQLAQAGYDTVTVDPAGGQVLELRLVRDVVVPEEAPHRPVSGSMEMGVSNRGSGVALALNVDMTKPRKALIATRIELRIKDRASGASLWEGHAEIVTREADPHWSDGAVATRLAGALFEHFPMAGPLVAQR